MASETDNQDEAVGVEQWCGAASSELDPCGEDTTTCPPMSGASLLVQRHAALPSFAVFCSRVRQGQALRMQA